MTTTKIHGRHALLKKLLPNFATELIRKFGTAILTPVNFSKNSGHFKSSFLKKSVDHQNNPIPWYTYPCIDFLKFIDFQEARVLEFGAGQSTLWWAKMAKQVVSMEGDQKWIEQLERAKPSNATVNLISLANPEACVKAIQKFLDIEDSLFDVIVIDGLYRSEMIPFTLKYLTRTGMIICDNSDGYGIQEAYADSGLKRIDFYGYAPGVILPHCTSIYFYDDCIYLSSKKNIAKIALSN